MVKYFVVTLFSQHIGSLFWSLTLLLYYIYCKTEAIGNTSRKKYDTSKKLSEDNLINMSQAENVAKGVKTVTKYYKYISKQEIMADNIIDKVLDKAGQGLAFFKPSALERKFPGMRREERDIFYLEKNLAINRTRQLLVPRVTKFIEKSVGRERDRIVMLVKRVVDCEFYFFVDTVDYFCYLAC